MLTIYPKPKEVKSGVETFPLPESLSITGGTARLEQHARDLFQDLGIDLVDASDTQIALVKTSVTVEGYGAYCLTIQVNRIRIESETEEGLACGLSSLAEVFFVAAGSDSKLVSTLVINDASRLAYRGVIEGYYGIPWTNEKRERVMGFGAKYKMNTYVFAPKDDPYHRETWWELYPTDELKAIGELAEYGHNHFINYVWTIAPFKAEYRPITAETAEEGIERLITKFEQLYACGVRQFGVLGDDVGVLPYETVVAVMNEINAWRKSKGDVLELIFCPEGYNMMDWAFKDGTELNIYESGFDADIQIFYTGLLVCAPLTDEAVHEFKTRMTETERRDPLFWMNWPVNDIDRETYRRVFMGPGEVYRSKDPQVTGVLMNPMEEAEASKVALFATLDYAWNPAKFDDLQSWKDSFMRIEPRAHEALRELASHMSAVSNGAMPTARESVALDEAGQAFVLNDDEANLRGLIHAYASILKAAQDFNMFAANGALVHELNPYVDTLHAKAKAALTLLESWSMPSAEKLVEAIRHRTAIEQNIVHTRTAEFPESNLRAEAGRKVMDPQFDRLKDLYSARI